MKVLFITRATLYTVYGGDTVQVDATAKYLRRLGVQVDIRLTNQPIDYDSYDLIHLFNIIRPADLLRHIQLSRKPYIVSTIFVDFSDYESMHRKGMLASLGNVLSSDGLEYVKAWARWIRNGEAIGSYRYMLEGHRRSVKKVAAGAQLLLPNSESEYRRFVAKYDTPNDYRVVYYAIDPEVFQIPDEAVTMSRDDREVICVARIEGKKNQLNLIRALNNTEFRLTLIGAPAPNHIAYYNECRRIAADNITFIDFMPQEALVNYYLRSKVHILASWNETCGLSTMEAGYAGCNVVVTDKGDTAEYFGGHAWFCDPGDPASICEAVRQAAQAPLSTGLRELIVRKYNWQEAARQTYLGYKTVLQTETVA